MPGLRPELLAPRAASLAPDLLALLEAPGGARVRLFDAATGRPRGEPYDHRCEVVQVALSQVRAEGGVRGEGGRKGQEGFAFGLAASSWR